MIGRVPRLPVMVGIVIAACACDNVSWGGMKLGLRGPGNDSTASVPDSVPPPEQEEASRQLGPLLYAGIRDGDLALITPVGEITDVGIRPLPQGQEGQALAQELLEGRLRPGEALELFSQGVRVGTVEVEGGETTDTLFCGVRALVHGHLLLTPEAVEAQRFLALKGRGPRSRSFEPYEALGSTYDQRVATLNLGAEAIPLVGATWPPSLLETRQDLQVFRLPGMDSPAVMATFVYQDRLRIGSAPDDAYSLMILGEPSGGTFNLAYTWYRSVTAQGKGAPRYFSRLDWDGDGDQEILLEVLGETSRWFAALNRGPEGWVTTFQDPCGTPGDPGA